MNVDGKILVSGAGVAGLTAAYWLTAYGFEVTVVERAPGLAPGGQGLDIRGPALQVAQRMNLLDTVRQRGTQQHGMSVVDAEGHELFRSTERTLTGGQFDAPDIEILRDDLCDVLFDAVGAKAEFLFGNRVAGLHTHDDGATVTFGNGVTRDFDLVIGADGLHSGVRGLVFGPSQDFHHHLSGYLAVFSVPNFLGLDHWQTFHKHDHAVIGVLGVRPDDRARAYVMFDTDERFGYDYRDVTAQKNLVAGWLAGAGWEVPRILAHLTDADDFHVDNYGQVRMDSWVRGPVALVGDAGFSTSPRTGQGTTVAMVAAYVLAGELAAHHGDLAAGLASYEAALRDYVIRNQRRAQELTSHVLLETSSEHDADTHPEGIPDFGSMTEPFALKNY